VATGSEAITSFDIEEMIKELARQEGLEVPAARVPHEGATIEVAKPSFPSGLSRNLPSSDPQLGKRIQTC